MWFLHFSDRPINLFVATAYPFGLKLELVQLLFIATQTVFFAQFVAKLKGHCLFKLQILLLLLGLHSQLTALVVYLSILAHKISFVKVFLPW